mmetsp:Transcript_44894/g.112582  ORF Transcript_44894/g.112582 Transcript_44894/m.112582 type:complete len:336 (+) Transcript_44894:989-1996(+)
MGAYHLRLGVLAEVDGCCCRVRPDAHVGLPVPPHGRRERRQQHPVVVALDDGAEVGAHLPDAVESRPPHAGVGVGEAGEDEVDDLRQVLLHLLVHSLPRLRYCHQATHAVPPVLLVLQERGHVPEDSRHEDAPSEGNSHAIERLLTHLKIAHSEPPPLILHIGRVFAIRLRVLGRPLLHVHVRVQVIHHQAEAHGHRLVHEVGHLLHHPGGLFAQLHQEVEGELAGRCLQRLRRGHLHNRLHNLRQVRPEELRVLRCQVNQLVQPRLRPGLVLTHRPDNDAEHLREERLQVARLPRARALFEVGHDCLQRGAPHPPVRAVEAAGVQGGQLLDTRR